MSDVIISPNMNLPVPVVGQELAPTWATDLNNSLALIDSHNHSSGQGVQINPSGIDINADLTFNINNATNLRTVRFSPQSVPIPATGSDIGCLFESGVDLYYNDGAGNSIRITQGGSVAGASGTITGLPSGTASASFQSSSGTFVFQQATSTAANLDIGTIIIRYPGSYPTPAGNYIALEAPSSLSTGYAITLPPAAAAANNSFLVESTAGVLSYVTPDNSTVTISGGVMSSHFFPVNPTMQIFTSGSGTYTTPSGPSPLYIKVTMIGGGGGGGGSNGTGGTNGTDTTFGGGSIVLDAGLGFGTGQPGGAGGGTVITGLTTAYGIAGGGGCGSGGNTVSASPGGVGGSSLFGGGGASPGVTGSGSNGTNGGGGGGSSSTGAAVSAGGGGGAGGAIIAIINSPVPSTFAYSVGTGGTGGTGGTTGGNGGNGIIIVEEYYQ